MLIFENPGEIDPKLISTFGVNVKPNSDSPIGFFGTGLKYALAVLMRLEASVVIQSGLKTFSVGVSKRKFRDAPFNIITLNKRALAFTTDVGKTWEPWMAYRELYCNAKDEGGHVWSAESAPLPEAGMTRVIVLSESMEKVHAEAGKWFLSDAHPVAHNPVLEVFPSSAHGLYYRGIFVGGLSKASFFTYNVKTQMELTEDRLAKYPWHWTSSVTAFWVECQDRELLTQALTAPKDTFERDLDFSYSSPSELFCDVVMELLGSAVPWINPSALTATRRQRQSAFLPAPMELSRVQTGALARACNFLRDIGLEVAEEINCVDSLGRDVLGMAVDGKIYLSTLAFDKGTKYLAGTILEEHFHLKYSVVDETREMQNLLIDKLITLGEQFKGKPL